MLRKVFSDAIKAICRKSEVPLTGIDAVSYTHLDVYKRQERERERESCLLCVCED